MAAGNAEGRGLGVRQGLALFALLLGGFGLSAFILRTQQEAAERGQRDRIEAAARGAAATVEANLLRAVETLRALDWLHRLEDGIDRETFRRYAGAAHAESGLGGALQWYPRVLASDVDALRAAAAAEGRPDFRLFERDAAGAVIDSPWRPVSYVVRYGVPEAETPEGLVFATEISVESPRPLAEEIESIRVHSLAMAVALERAAPVVTAPHRAQVLEDPEAPPEHRGMAVTLLVPVFRGGEGAPVSHRRSALAGFMGHFTPLSALLRGVRAPLDAAGLDLHLYDAGGGPPRLVYRLRGDGAAAVDDPLGSDRTEGSVQLPLAVPGREWILVVSPRGGVIAGRDLLLVWLLPIAFLLLTVALVALVARMLRDRHALERAQQRLRRIADHLPVGVFQADAGPGGGLAVSFVNRSAGPLAGVDPDRLVREGLLLFQHLDPAQRESLERDFADAAAHGRALSRALRLAHPEGERRLLIAATPHGRLGERTQFSGFLEDVTAESLQRERLDALVEEQETLLGSVPVGIVFTEGRRVLRCNPAFAQMLGYADPEQAVGTHFATFFADEAEHKAYRQSIAVRLKAGRVVESEQELRRRDGSRVWVQLVGRRLPGSEREIWMAEDIDRRKAQEAELAAQYTFQQQLIDGIPNPVFFKGPDARFLGCNRAYEAAFGVRREDLVGRTVLDLPYLPPAAREAYHAEDVATIAAAAVVHRELTLTYADGDAHDVLYWVSGFRRADGSPGGLVGVFVDISAQKRAERALAVPSGFRQSLLDALPAPLWLLDADGRHRGCNRAFEQAFGIARDRLLGRRAAEIPDYPAALAALAQVADGEHVPAVGEIRRSGTLRFADGRARAVEVVLVGLDGRDGEAGGTVAVLRVHGDADSSP